MEPTDTRKNYLDLTNLIRSIQRAEGNADCFRRAEGYCDKVTCAWHRYCAGDQSMAKPDHMVRDQSGLT